MSRIGFFKTAGCAIMASIFICFAVSSYSLAEDESRQEIQYVIKELKMLKAQMAEKDREIKRLHEEQEALRRALRQRDREIELFMSAYKDRERGPIDKEAQGEQGGGPGFQVDFGGQYRINSYTVHDSVGGEHITASRLRVRQNIDFRFDEAFSTHLQLELGHTTGNIGTTRNDIKVRHAVMGYKFTENTRFDAGILPLSDIFHDTLFSSDWDYNPLAMSLSSHFGPGEFRVFLSELDEGDEPLAHDDFTHYELDYIFSTGKDLKIKIGGAYLEVADPVGGHTRPHFNYGLGVEYAINDEWGLNSFLLGSFTDNQLLGSRGDGMGIATFLEINGHVFSGDLGILASYASGEEDGSGFLPVMALSRTYGYWGYTGLLTVQGPTDTGFDSDAVNISNNGHGLTTLQIRYEGHLSSRMSYHLAAGWYGNTSVPEGRSSQLGVDLMGMLTYRFNKFFALDTGLSYARLRDGISGYYQGVYGGNSFTSRKGELRDKLAFFSRLQAEF